MANLSTRLKDTLKLRGITQKELAEKAETTGSTISRYMNDERTPNAELLAKIAAVLDVTTDYLLYGSDKSMSQLSDKEAVNCKSKKQLSAEDQQIAEEIYNKLVEVGFIADGEKITDRHLDVLFEVLAPQIEFARFKLNKSK